MTVSLDDFCRQLEASGAVTAGYALVADRRSILARRGFGRIDSRKDDRVPGWSSRFDLASLTKPLVATLALVLDREGVLPLDLRIAEIWPNAAPGLGHRRLEDLLRHRSGLIAWAPLYTLCRRRGEVVNRLIGGDLWRARRGTYSDLGYVLWGLALERSTGMKLDAVLARYVSRRLGRCAGPAIARPGARRDVVRCSIDNRREVALAAALPAPVGPIRLAPRRPPTRGRVQDGNTAFLGGLAGHAGLFGSASYLLRFAREWLGPGRLLSASQKRAALSGSGRYRLGWEMRRTRGDGGPGLDRGAFGHIGFTGGSLWIDPGKGRIYLLLAHRTSKLSDVTLWRRRFHRL